MPRQKLAFFSLKSSDFLKNSYGPNVDLPKVGRFFEKFWKFLYPLNCTLGKNDHLCPSTFFPLLLYKKIEL